MPLQVVEHGRTFRWYSRPDTSEINPAFDGKAFVQSWARYVGSAHRYFKTGELILCWSTNGPHPLEREMLRERLEAHPGNVGAVLAAIDAEIAALNYRTLRANAGKG